MSETKHFDARAIAAELVQINLRGGYECVSEEAVVHALYEAYAAGLEKAAAIAKRSQDECFCAPNDSPCGGCMEAARIEGAIYGIGARVREGRS